MHKRQVTAETPVTETERWIIAGHVQGVGFRPFVYRLAHHFGLTGWVRNHLGQVEVVAQGNSKTLAAFGEALVSNAPLIAKPQIEAVAKIESDVLIDFVIAGSRDIDTPKIQLPPDYFLCSDCLAEMTNPHNRRYRYPFINCTQCGPRYTLIKRLPYDRPNTTMADFALCWDCQQEYEDPLNRRFHAEPIACPVCGPSLEFHQRDAQIDQGTQSALHDCIATLKAGHIVAVKGIGGYHLFCDARNDFSIARLRANKPRPDKPLAVLFPQQGLQGADAVLAEVHLNDREVELLTSSGRPILLARKRSVCSLSYLIAPGLNEVGVMLPYSPLHHLLVDDFAGPLVATSANISGEPVLTNNGDAERRLSRVAEAYLHHNRPIERPADDSVYRMIQRKPRPLRLGRGYAPVELNLPVCLGQPVLAVGGHIKNTVALGWQDRVVVSAHIGDLHSPRSQAVFEQVMADLQSLYRVKAATVVYDAHPGYASTRWAQHCGLPLQKVYHHHAHASALVGEHAGNDIWMVFTWDGIGMGEDGTLWGGEVLTGRPGAWCRTGSFRPFYLPGGEQASREPWRSAAALCWETQTDWSNYPQDTELLYQAWRRRLNCHKSSAVGRLFDAAASLIGLLHEASFEGQGPMLLEAVAEQVTESKALPINQDSTGLWLVDWQPLLSRLQDGACSLKQRAAAFHGAMARVILDQARLIRDQQGIEWVGLCGGVFQNRLLCERAVTLLEKDGFKVRLTEKLPCNDGGLSFGQVIEYGAITLDHR